jgi:large subunit ribosomal protein L6
MSVKRTVTIPEGVSVSKEGTILKVKGQMGQLERDVWYPGVDVTVDGEHLIISTESRKKQVTAMVGTLAAHGTNMCKGVMSGYEYTMKVVYSHFPIQLKLQGEKLEIVNFLGEKNPRHAKILPGIKVKVGTDQVTVSGLNKELVGSTAANIERATRIRDRDPRVFQDGIYVVSRGE